MTATEKDLLALEKKFWTGDAKFYQDNVDDSCLVAFGAGYGRRDEQRGDRRDRQGQGNRWKNLDIKLKGLIEPADDVAILSYEANATRSNGEHYAALVSTGYARRDDGWKMMFHQQTPLGQAERRGEIAPACRHHGKNCASPSSVLASSFSYLRRGTSIAPKRFRCSVVNCVSSSVKPRSLQPLDQMDQADLRGVALAREHAFAEEGAAERHAVEAADQPAVAPGFDRVAVAAPEELDIGLADRRVDPGVAAALARSRRSRR